MQDRSFKICKQIVVNEQKTTYVMVRKTKKKLSQVSPVTWKLILFLAFNIWSKKATE